MAIPSKKRKRIDVNGTVYHYSIGRRLNDAHTVVQHASGSGPKILIQWVGLIVPRHVRSAIEHALSLGWKHDSGSDLEFGCDSFADPIEFHTRPDNASQYWFFDQWFADNPDRVFNSPMPGFKPPP